MPSLSRCLSRTEAALEGREDHDEDGRRDDLDCMKSSCFFSKAASFRSKAFRDFGRFTMGASLGSGFSKIAQ